MPRKAEDLTGRTFGNRKVLRRAASRDYAGNKTIYWICRCFTCGYTSDVQGSSLKRGAGCPRCVKNGTQSPVQPQPSPNPKKPATATLTVGKLKKELSELPDHTTLRVHLSGQQGWATVLLKNVSVKKGVVLLLGSLPKRVEPWRDR